MKEVTVYELYKYEKLLEELKDSEIVLEGWVRTNRDNGSLGFIELNDGSFFKNLQLVYDNNTVNFEEVSHFSNGDAIQVRGILVLTPEAKQPFELHLIEGVILGKCQDDYPLQKKRHGFEFLRDIAHLRMRTNTFNALFRVRSTLSYAIHKFFFERDFVYVHTPIITTNDAEGAGQTFKVITDDKNPNVFFGTPSVLTVSGQLHVEPFALAFRNVYTFGPTFRAEKSNTTRHAAEFWMIEPEMAFTDLNGNMSVIEDFIKYIIKFVLERNKEEMNFFNTFIDKDLLNRLNHVLNSKFEVMPYTKAIEYLLKAKESGHKFENNVIKWGMDLQSEHERYLTEVIVKGPMFLIDFPKEIKAFYMKLNKDNKTVAGCDLLVPGVGELVGGSQREEDYEKLKAKMEEVGNDKELYWYLDTRKYGGCVHSGFGLGFDRFLMYITGISNIRDTQPYPRTFGSIKY